MINLHDPALQCGPADGRTRANHKFPSEQYRNIGYACLIRPEVKRRRTTLTDPTICCPNCRAEIRLTESLAGPLLADTRREFECKLADKDKEIARRESTLRDQQQAVER